MATENNSYINKEQFVLDTDGVNLLEIMNHTDVNFTSTYSNDIYEMYDNNKNKCILFLFLYPG